MLLKIIGFIALGFFLDYNFRYKNKKTKNISVSRSSSAFQENVDFLTDSIIHASQRVDGVQCELRNLKPTEKGMMLYHSLQYEGQAYLIKTSYHEGYINSSLWTHDGQDYFTVLSDAKSNGSGNMLEYEAIFKLRLQEFLSSRKYAA